MSVYLYSSWINSPPGDPAWEYWTTTAILVILPSQLSVDHDVAVVILLLLATVPQVLGQVPLGLQPDPCPAPLARLGRWLNL